MRWKAKKKKKELYTGNRIKPQNQVRMKIEQDEQNTKERKKEASQKDMKRTKRIEANKTKQKQGENVVARKITGEGGKDRLQYHNC